MRKILVVLVVVSQLAVLIYMAGKREILYHSGRRIFLRTAPVDPQDLFRGDYVSLNYEISRVPRKFWSPSLLKPFRAEIFPAGLPVYASLKEGEEGRAELVGLSDVRPSTGLYLQGKILYYSGYEMEMPVRYGLEAYFVEEGKGREIEAGRQRDEIQVPLEMEVAVAQDGSSQLITHRWSRVGIGIKLESDKSRPPRVYAATVQLMNSSDKPLAVVDLPTGGSLRLVGVSGSTNEVFQCVSADAPVLKPSESDVHMLQPNEIYEFNVNFWNPMWFVVKNSETPKALPELQSFGQRFRFVYAPPSTAECKELREAAQIWHGTLSTRAFSGGRVD